MLKLIGAAALIVSSAGIGMYKSLRLKKRCDSLQTLCLCAEHIGAEIAFGKKRIECIFNETGREYGLRVFTAAALRIKNNGVRLAWRESLAEYAGEMALAEQDITAADLLGGAAADFGGAEQQRGIRTAGRMISLAHEAAQAEYDRTARLWRSGGALCGMLAAILLL